VYPDRNRPDDFAQFTTARRPRLVCTVYMLTGDFHEAEDLVQTTLIKVYLVGRLRRQSVNPMPRQLAPYSRHSVTRCLTPSADRVE
jgi:DNA-directed RNA polymerase specialized sigma24 family protein